MSVYVDSLLQHGNPTAPKCFLGKKSCHMYADSLDELHNFAKKIGLSRNWFQTNKTVDHYDLVESRRKIAVSIGAIEHDRESAIAKWKELK